MTRCIDDVLNRLPLYSDANVKAIAICLVDDVNYSSSTRGFTKGASKALVIGGAWC